MNSRERFHATMQYKPVDHVPFVLPWLGFPETLQRWRQEGYKDGDFGEYKVDQWIWEGIWFFPYPPFENTVLEDDGRHITYVNNEGIIMRELKDNPWSSMPQFVRFPVETREDFRKFAAEHLQPDIAARIGGDWVARLKQLREQPVALWVIADRWGGFFGPLRNMLGVENLCMAFYTDPDFVEEMMDTIADYVIVMAGQLLDHIEVDIFGLWEDMAFNHGPLISPDLVRRYMLPRYKKVVEFLKGRGVPWVCLDSDGLVETLVPIWLDAGINILYPFEVAARNDIVAMRRQYGKDLRMYMGLDKRSLAQDKGAIDREIERVRPLVEEGGYIPSVDHSIPPDVSYSNFRYYMERMMDVLGVA